MGAQSIKRYKRVYEWARSIRAFCYRVISRFLSIMPLDKNKIVFDNFNGKGFGDNPKYLAISLHNTGAYKLCWLVNDLSIKMPDYICPIKRNSISGLYHMATAKIWIGNSRKDPFYYKRKGQFYLQTWHGSVALKRIEQDVENLLDKYYVDSAKRDSKMIDLMISDSGFTDQLFKNSFWYSGDIKRFGSPRIDCLFKENNIEKIRRDLNISQNDYVVLYAPTFRNSLRMDVYDLDYKAVEQAFREKVSRNIRILVRMHPNLTWVINNFDFHGATDVTEYSDVYELLLIADALITDYSTLMFEFPVAVRKPVFCYARDKNEYDRGFYFSLEDLPFVFCENNKDLVHSIMQYNANDYRKRIDEFYKKIGLYNDGRASERTVNYLVESVLKELR